MTACKVCSEGQRDDVDRALIQGESGRRVAARFGYSETGLRRHRVHHLGRRLQQASEQRDDVNAKRILDRMADLAGQAQLMRTIAIEDGDLRAALRSISIESKILDTLGTKLGLSDLTIAQWNHEAAALITALGSLVTTHPDAVTELAGVLAAQGDAGPSSVAAALLARVHSERAQIALTTPAPPTIEETTTA